MACPGSVQLSETIPQHDTTTKYAAEGTAAHEVAEMSLRTGVDPEMYVGKKIDGITVTKEMALAVGVYVDKVNTLAKSLGAEPKLEVQFSLGRLNPKEPMFGTADCVVYDELTGHLHVLDYKHGRGVVVEAVDNPQLQYYALGAVLELGVKPREITVWIIQPRAPHKDGVVRDWSFDWEHLVAFRHELMTAAYRTRDEDPPLSVGDHCRFCPASAICPAQKEHALTVVQDAFVEAEPPALPGPETLTKEEIEIVLAQADHLMAWLRDVKSYAHEQLEQGHEVEGWKLITKKGNRTWADPEVAKQILREDFKFKVKEITSTKLLSPSQIEALLRRRGEQLPEGLVYRAEKGYNMVEASDPRPEAIPTQIAEVFTAEADAS
jgi:hypothetical protein